MKLDRIIAVRNTKTIYRDGKLCFKVFNSEFSKTDVLNEALNQSRAEEAGLNVPKVRGVTAASGKWAIISDHIKGETLEFLMAEHPERKSEYLELFVKLQHEINSRAIPSLPNLNDKLMRKTTIADLDNSARLALQDTLSETVPKSALCHGDFTPSNIIIAKHGTPYVLDWSHAASGDCAYDSAVSYILFLQSGDTACAEEYLELYSKMSGIEKEHIKKWVPISAAAMSVGKNEATRKFLNSIINK